MSAAQGNESEQFKAAQLLHAALRNAAPFSDTDVFNRIARVLPYPFCYLLCVTSCPCSVHHFIV